LFYNRLSFLDFLSSYPDGALQKIERIVDYSENSIILMRRIHDKGRAKAAFREE
jgi:hypothetical protein